MKTNTRLLLAAACSALLSGCLPAEMPKTPAEAAATLKSARAALVDVGHRVQTAQQDALAAKESAAQTVEAGKAVLVDVGETAQSGVETAKSTLEAVGDTTTSVLSTAKSGLEAVGETVISIAAPAPTEEPPR